MTTNVRQVPGRRAGFVFVEFDVPMPIGRLDALLDTIEADHPRRRKVFRCGSPTGDEIVFAVDRRGRKVLEVRPSVDGGLLVDQMVFRITRRLAEWKLASRYGWRSGPHLDALVLAAERAENVLPALDRDPLVYPYGAARCGICGRKLTDEMSVGIGIGPECGARYPWLFDERAA